jgi:ankyrin repeat protein
MLFKKLLSVLLLVLTLQTGYAQLFPAPNQNVKDAFSLASSLYSSHRKKQAFENRINAMVTISTTTSDPEQLVREYQEKMRQLQYEAERRKEQKEAELRKQIDLINKGVDEALKAADVDLGTYGNILKDIGSGVAKNSLVANANTKIEAARIDAQLELDNEMKKAMGGIYEQIVKENETAQKEYLFAAAEVFAEREEQHYLAYFEFYNCMLTSMKKNYNYRSADWLKTACNTPPRTYFSAGQSASQLNYTNYNSNNSQTFQPDLTDLTPESQLAAIDKKLEESVKKVEALIAKEEDAFQKVEYLSLKQNLIDKAKQEKEAINKGEIGIPEPTVNNYQKQKKQYQPLLDCASRKLALYKSTMPYPEFLESAKKYAEAELSENNQNANGYVFLAELSNDVSEKYMLTGYALFLDRNNSEIGTKFKEAKANFGTALFSAIDKNKLDFVKDAQNRNLLNGFEHNKNTPFQYAVSVDNAEAMDLLMPPGTDQYALLYYVIENGGTNVAQKLLKSLDINRAPLANGYDLLTAAVYFDKKSIAFELLKNNFKYNNSLEIARYSSPALYKKMTTTLSMYAIEKDNAAMLDNIIKKTPSILKPNAGGKENVVDVVVKGNKTKLFPILVQNGLNIKDANYSYLMELAINSNAEELAMELVNLGANLNVQPKVGGSLINLLASKKSMDKLFETLIQKGVSVSAIDNNNDLAVMTAMKNEQLSKTKVLLANNAPIGFKSKLGGNQIHWLIENGIDAAFIPLLAGSKISVDGQDNNGDTPLFFAIKNYKNNYTQVLLNQGSDVNLVNNSGISALQYAVYQKSADMNTLVQYCNNPNAQGINGWTALHFAVREGNIDAVNLLLQANASLLVTDKWGRTPYRISREYGFDAIQKVLRKNMGMGNLIKTAYVFNKKKAI